jgi:hypothetical protein
MPSQGEARCSDVTSIPHVSEARCDTFHRKDNTDKKCRDRKDEREVGPALGTGSWTHMSENRELTDEGLYASKSLASLVNVYIPYIP